MRYLPLALAFLTPTAFADNVLSPGSSYPVMKELTAPATLPASLESYFAEMKMDFDSYDAADPSATPVMGTHTEQLLRVKKLPKLSPKDPLYSANGLNALTELDYEKLLSSSRVRVPGMKAPFETRSDLGAILSGKRILLRGNGPVPSQVDNLDDVKKAALAETRDATARTTLQMMLSPELVLKTGASTGQDSSCAGQLGGKKPQEKWTVTAVAQGTATESACTFDGWSEAKGKRIAVIRVVMGKQRVARKLPDGRDGNADTEGEGVIYCDPLSGETLISMDTRILLEPTNAEATRLKSLNRPVPRNRSVMHLETHVFPL